MSGLLSTAFYSGIVISLFLVDYALGNGFAELCHNVFFSILSIIKSSLKKETLAEHIAGLSSSLSMPMLFLEIITLSLTVMFLNKYKHYRCRDRIDELLRESKNALRQINDLSDKWRLKRQVNSYLDEEPQEIKPFKLEVPILHMAIIDTKGTRSQPESGDAGDTINITDSTLLSLTSLLDDDDDYANDFTINEGIDDKIINETKKVDFGSRYLWDLMEEDVIDC